MQNQRNLDENHIDQCQSDSKQIQNAEASSQLIQQEQSMYQLEIDSEHSALNESKQQTEKNSFAQNQNIGHKLRKIRKIKKQKLKLFYFTSAGPRIRNKNKKKDLKPHEQQSFNQNQSKKIIKKQVMSGTSLLFQQVVRNDLNKQRSQILQIQGHRLRKRNQKYCYNENSKQSAAQQSQKRYQKYLQKQKQSQYSSEQEYKKQLNSTKKIKKQKKQQIAEFNKLRVQKVESAREKQQQKQILTKICQQEEQIQLIKQKMCIERLKKKCLFAQYKNIKLKQQVRKLVQNFNQKYDKSQNKIANIIKNCQEGKNQKQKLKKKSRKMLGIKIEMKNNKNNKGKHNCLQSDKLENKFDQNIFKNKRKTEKAKLEQCIVNKENKLAKNIHNTHKTTQSQNQSQSKDYLIHKYEQNSSDPQIYGALYIPTDTYDRHTNSHIFIVSSSECECGLKQK